jgi:hypothetical protein
MSTDLPNESPDGEPDGEVFIPKGISKSYVKVDGFKVNKEFEAHLANYLSAKQGAEHIAAQFSRARAIWLIRFITFVADFGGHRNNFSNIERPPGFQLVKVLEFLCRRKTVERVIQPMHAEFLTEYYTATEGRHIWKARYIKAQMQFYLVYAVASEKVFSLIGKCFNSAFKAKSED